MAKTYSRVKVKEFIDRLERDRRIFPSRLSHVTESERNLVITLHDSIMESIIDEMRSEFDIWDDENMKEKEGEHGKN